MSVQPAVIQPDALLSQQTLFRQIAEKSLDAVVIIDENSGVVFWNAAAERLFGWRADQVLGHDVHDHITPERHRERAKWAARQYQSADYRNAFGRTMEIEAVRADGEEIWIELTLSGIDVAGRPWAFAFIRDVTDRRRRIEDLERQTQTDELTGIGNRRSFSLALEKHRNEALFLMILDLDHFKQVNDRHGHPAGDSLLCQLADLLQRSCPSAHVVARMGGDEFGVIWVGCSRQRVAAEIAQLQLSSRTLNNPATGRGLALSGGVAASEDIGHLPYRLTQAADRALYRAKRSGRGQIAWTRTPEGQSGEWVFP